MGRRGTSKSSRNRAESPHCDSRSKTTVKSAISATMSSRGRARERTKNGSVSKRSGSRDTNRTGSYKPPTERQPDPEPERSTIVSRHAKPEKQMYESRDDEYAPKSRSRDDGYHGSRSRSRDDGYHGSRSHRSRSRSRDATHRSRSRDDDHGTRSSSKDRRRRREREKQKEYERERERERRERHRSDRKRRVTSTRGNRVYDVDAQLYRQFDEVVDFDDVQYKPPRQAASLTDDVAGDPFNLCAGSESFSDAEQMPPSRTRRSRRDHRLANASMSTAESRYDAGIFGDQYDVRQNHSCASIAVAALQLLVLMLQLAMCGVAPLEVNPMVGPFPDAFSEWGGKNAYLMLEEKEYWRLVTPAFLHVGVLHLLANSFCLLYSSALFEREWGSCTWLFIFFVSEIGCVGVSSISDPNTVAVGSSGALMGLFAAKLSHVLTYTFFETYDISRDEGIHVDQLGSVLCGLTLVSLLSSFTFVDWSGHMGGLASGFFAGMFVFSSPIKSCCGKLLWGLLGLAGLAGIGFVVGTLLANEIEPDEELSDSCEYFRNLYPEGYECGCL